MQQSSNSANAGPANAGPVNAGPVNAGSANAGSANAGPATESSSTNSILKQLSSNQYDIQLFKAVVLLLKEKEQTTIDRLKKIIVILVTKHNASLVTPIRNHTILQELLAYYRGNGVKDELFDLLRKFESFMSLVSLCTSLFRRRWHDKTKLECHHTIFQTTELDNAARDLVRISLDCRNIAEATLAAQMLETVLQENYGIPFRSSVKYMPATFRESEGGSVCFNSCYRPEDYLNVAGPVQLTVKDECLMQLFQNGEKDLYDYCQAKYRVCNTRGLNIDYDYSDHDAVSNHDAVSKAALEAISNPIFNTSEVQNFACRILIVSRIGLGSGNYMNALLTIEGLCKILPLLKIDWVVATDGEPLPTRIELPPQVTRYETDALWKLYPLIRAISLEADVVASIPNNFLRSAQCDLMNTPLYLAEKSVVMVVSEYQYDEAHTSPSHYLVFNSGIDAGKCSLGLLKPKPLALPSSLVEKRALLCQNEKAAKLFLTQPESPLYFGYVYNPQKNVVLSTVRGLKIIDVLALFVQHAKCSKHKSITVVLPINQETIAEAIQRYSRVFEGCRLDYCDLSDKQGICDGMSLNVSVFNVFPIENTTFRSLMDYAAACNTPVVTTGDQSFMEQFFTMREGFVSYARIWCMEK